MEILLVETERGAADGLAHALHDLVALERAPWVSAAGERLLVGAPDGVLISLGDARERDLDLVERVLLAALQTPVVVVARSCPDELAVRMLALGVQDVLGAAGAAPPAEDVVRALRHAGARHRRVVALSHQALHDPLTGLPNRLLFLDRLRQALSRLERTSTCLAVIFADLDGFKAVNDSRGHEAGDAVLAAVADRLRAALRGGDTAARMGGDEFVVLCEDIAGERQACRVASRLLSGLPTSASMGIALAAAGGPGDPQALIRAADAAMYRVKRAGGAGYCVDGGAPVHPAAVRPA